MMQAAVLRPYFLIGLVVAALALTFFILKPFLVPLVLAGVFAVVLQPVYQTLLRVLRGRKALASLFSIAAIAFVVIVPLSFVLSKILAEARGLYDYFTSEEGSAALYTLALYLQDLASSIMPGAVAFNAESFFIGIEAYLTKLLEAVVGHLGDILSGVSNFVLSLLLFFIALYYLLKDGHALKRNIMELSPLSSVDEERILDRLGLAVNSVVRGNLFIALIQGIVATVGFVLFGLPNPVLWGTVVAISALIPAVGTALVMVPAVLYLLVAASLPQAVGLAAWAVLAVGLIDNMLGPKLVGKGAGLHPLLILLSVLGGLVLFGPAGIFLGPLSTALLFALLTIQAESSRET